jgi:transposase
MAVCVGIDVAKYTLEWSLGSEGKIQHTRNEPRPIAQLARRLVEIDPERIVVESTGGYERALVQKLAEAGLPVVVANPRRVRSFAVGMGFLAKTDANRRREEPSRHRPARRPAHDRPRASHPLEARP